MVEELFILLLTKGLGIIFANDLFFTMSFAKFTGNKNRKIPQNSKQGTIKFLELLAQKGADFSSADGEGQTPLHLATNARNHDGACVKYLIKKINRT